MAKVSGKDIVYRNISDGVATLTLNRPNESNAMTQPLWDAHLQHLQHCASNDDVRVIVLTGAGRSFCAGADISRLRRWADGEKFDLPMERPRPIIPDALDVPAGFDDRFSYLVRVPKPIIAAINGPAVGSGFALAMFSDIRFAAADAKLSSAFARLGLIGEMALPWIMSRITSPHVTADLLFSSRFVTGTEAAQMGLINYSYPRDQLMEIVMEYARGMARTGTNWSQARIKEQIYCGLVQKIDAAVDSYYPIMERSLKSEGFRTRLRAMLQSM